MRNRTYDILAWVFTLLAVVFTLYIWNSYAAFFIELVLLVLGISICGMVLSINAAKTGSPEKWFLPPLILSVICTAVNGMLFVSCVMINIQCGGLPFLFTHMG
ncbi:MAG: hypothetical protein HDT21_14240 [Ruminococcus sp.]|nr:hypothetical protein [Ruminococcus sp.]